MARRKKLPKLPDYAGIPKTGSQMIVQKTNPLQSLSETDMTLPEFKILDAYLSRIDSHKPDKRYVRFEKGELEQILGISRILKSDLEKRLDNLFTAITIRDPEKPKGFVKIGLFAKAEANQDENGLWQIDLACTEEAMEYIFNPENLGYLKYRLKNVIDLTSRYSYILYLYLERNRWRKTWKIGIDELKLMLNCTAERYTQYKFFNSEILKKCHKELNEKTSIKYTYEPCDKKNRKYTAIRFTIQTVTDELAEVSAKTSSQQLLFDGYEDDKEEENVYYGGELAELLGDAACHNEFSPEQIRIIQDYILRIMPNSDNLNRCNYLVNIIHKLNYYESRNKIHNRFDYLCSMLKNEIDDD